MPSFSTTLVSVLSLAAASTLAAVLPQHATTTFTPGPGDGMPGPGVTHAGDLTYYTPDLGTGACGHVLTNTDAICALSGPLFDKFTPGGNPNNNPLCGRTIQITMADGRTKDVTVADRCDACVGWDVDVTPPTFEGLVPGGLDIGRTKTTWKFLD